MPTLAADVQDYRDAITWTSFTAGILSAMRATYRELHRETPSLLLFDLATERACIKGSRPRSARCAWSCSAGINLIQ